MSEDQIIQHCSPTLAGIKTGNLFRCHYSDKGEFLDQIRSLNKSLVPKGVSIIPVRLSEDCALIYVYRPSKLKEDLSDNEAADMLRSYGYEVSNPNCCVSKLCKRLCVQQEFPHEVGLFLGYPPADVKGFIESPSKGYKMIGFWKVYGDEKKAARKFELYRKCERIYKQQFSNGKSIEHLTVADVK